MFIIRHKTGALAGREQRVEKLTIDRVIFGRDVDVCDVVFPADETIVGRRHFALIRRPLGEWTFDLFGKQYVAVDGRLVAAGTPVQSGTIIELGRPGGPSFEIRLVGEGSKEQLATTAPQHEIAGRRDAARTRLLGIVGAVIALMAAAGAVAYMIFTRN